MAERSTSLGEFAGLGGMGLARSMGTPVPGGAQQVSMSTTAAYSTVLPEGLHIAVTATVACFIRMSIDNTTPAVVGSDLYVPANTTIYVRMGRNNANVPYKYISSVLSTGTGTLYLCPMEGNQY